MEATLGQTIQFATSIDGDKLGRKPGGLFQFYSRPRAHKRLLFLSSVHSRHGRTCTSSKDVSLKEASHSCRHSPGSVWQSGSFLASFDEAKILKNKSEEIEPYLDGRCIYLVGMMGSGKTTVGKILSESLGYSFYDCDALIEQSVGGVPVKEIFELHGENFFRDNETEALRKLSSMHRLVVSTGGGAVVRPINWKYMHKGISVWLDVPLEVLAKRVAADGTQSRPLLHQESGDAYSRAYTQLTTLLEERGEAYENANARVCFRHIVAKLGGYLDVFNPTPAVIAIEVLDRIEGFLKR